MLKMMLTRALLMNRLELATEALTRECFAAIASCVPNAINAPCSNLGRAGLRETITTKRENEL